MPTLKLISHKLCPYVQRAAILLAEKGAPFEREDIDLGNKPDWFLRLSPLGKVPVLVVQQDGREEVLFESAVIAEYLDETITPRFHPDDPLERARHRAWIEFASATLADIAGYYSAPDEGAFAAKRAALDAKFARLEEALGDGPLFGGKAFSLVDAAFAPVFRYFDLFDRVTGENIVEGRPKLAAWRLALQARPSVVGAVAGDYTERLRDFTAARDSHLGRLAAGAGADALTAA